MSTSSVSRNLGITSGFGQAAGESWKPALGIGPIFPRPRGFAHGRGLVERFRCPPRRLRPESTRSAMVLSGHPRNCFPPGFPRNFAGRSRSLPCQANEIEPDLVLKTRNKNKPRGFFSALRNPSLFLCAPKAGALPVQHYL